MLPYCCQAPPGALGAFLWRVPCSSMYIRRADERTRTTLLLIMRVWSVVAGRCRGMQIPHSQAKGFLFPRLPGIADCCVRVRVKSQWLTHRRFLRRPDLTGSFEYAFMPGGFHEDQTSRNPPL